MLPRKCRMILFTVRPGSGAIGVTMVTHVMTTGTGIIVTSADTDTIAEGFTGTVIKNLADLARNKIPIF